jgi:effector-binding domain-containing protein
MAKDDQIRHKNLSETWIVSQRVQLRDRSQLPGLFQELEANLPAGSIAGPPFCVIQFITSITDGYDAEICIPVGEAFGQASEVARLLPKREVLSLIHQGPIEELGGSYRSLYAWAAERGVISDEFCQEIYLDSVELNEIEIQFVIHPWERLLEGHLSRVLGEEGARRVASGREALTAYSSLAERFQWVQSALTNLESAAGEGASYEILSRCAHVFPAGQIAKLRAVYLEAEKKSGDMLEAVDDVIDFMAEDPGWGEGARREGYTIYSSKKPRDPAGYEKAETPEEKRKAYCFCPLIRENLDGGMPPSFCYCGAGWFRQQWEGATGESVKIEIIRSLLKGDDQCEFAITLPEEKPVS